MTFSAALTLFPNIGNVILRDNLGRKNIGYAIFDEESIFIFETLLKFLFGRTRRQQYAFQTFFKLIALLHFSCFLFRKKIESSTLV